MKRKGQWSDKEDYLLVQAVKSSKYNYKYLKDEIKSKQSKNESKLINWDKVQSYFQGTRNVAQCRQRYLNYLSPNIRKENFSSAEDQAIVIMFKKFGSKWSKFKENQLLRGRTVFSIRTRFRTLMKNNIAQDNLCLPASQADHILSRISESCGVLKPEEIECLSKYNLNFLIDQNLTPALATEDNKELEVMCEAVEGIIGMNPQKSKQLSSSITTKTVVKEEDLRKELLTISKDIQQLEEDIFR